MTQSGQPPIAHTHDGQPVFPAQSVATGQPQPLGVLSDGEPVWPAPKGHLAPGQPHPFGVLGNGQFIYGQYEADAVGSKKPLWKKKKFLIPVGVLVFLIVVGSFMPDPATTEVTANASDTQSAPSAKVAAKTPAQKAAEKAVADKAAAEKAVADKAAAAKAAAEKAVADKAAAAKAAAEKAVAHKAAAAKAAADRAAAKKAAAAKAARERPVSLSARDFAKLVKNPDAYTGRYFIVYGEVTQFDSATGDEHFLADSGASKSGVEYGMTDFSDNTLYEGDARKLTDVVEGDVFRATVEVLGSESYDTQIGGNTTVPKFRLTHISVYASTK